MNSTPIFHEPNFGLAACASSPTTLGNATVYPASVTGGTNVQHTWDFGDGQSGVGPAPSHFYTAAGSYTIVVTASNSLGEISTRLTVHVNPTAQVDEAITVLTISTQGSTVVGERVDVVTSSAGGSGVRYAWDFGDGATGDGVTASHLYAAAGDYLVRVTATNGVSSVAAEMVVQVTDKPGGGDRNNQLFLPMISK